MALVNPLDLHNARYTARRGLFYSGAKKIIMVTGGKEAMQSLSGGVGQEVASTVGASTLGFGLTLPVITTLGLTAAVSAGLTQMDYRYKRNAIKQLYKEELAIKLKKPVNELTDQDLEMLARGDSLRGIGGNRVIAEEIDHSKKERNFGIFLSFVASLASLAAVAYFPIPMPESLLAGAAPFIEKAVAFVVHGIQAVIAYHLAKTPLHWVADKLFGLDKETTHDRIESLSRDREAGKIISPEQVLSVFASAYPQLDRFIAAEYGQNFDKLPLAVKQQAVVEIGKLSIASLSQVTSPYNARRIDIGVVVDPLEEIFFVGLGLHENQMAARRLFKLANEPRLVQVAFHAATPRLIIHFLRVRQMQILRADPQHQHYAHHH